VSGRSVFGRLGCGSSPVWRTSSGSAPADVPSPTNERQRGAPPTSSLPKTGVAQRRPSSWHTAQPAKSSSPSQSDAQPAKSDGAAATPRAVSSSMMIQGSDRQTGDMFSQPAASTRDMILLQTKEEEGRREGRTRRRRRRRFFSQTDKPGRYAGTRPDRTVLVLSTATVGPWACLPCPSPPTN
jgi:hypothetical protein